MNNKGFAITGILYTLFVLFVMILLSILGSISYKKFILEKTISGIEDSFDLEEIENINSTYDNQTRKTNYDAKYIFESIIPQNNNEHLVCSVYLKKGSVIPNQIDPANPKENFTLIPKSCNKYSFSIKLSGQLNQESLTLTKVYKFKGSD